MVDEVADVRALADELGFDRFGLNGGSGGGPHVLACAALLPDRVVRAICDVGVAPLGSPGLEQDAWLAGMDPENVKEFGWALAGEDVLTRELQALQQQFEERARVDVSTVLQDMDMSESDRAELARPEIAQIIRESTFEWAANGVGGWVDDDLAVLQPWWFDLADISVPVLVRYGMTDVFVPPAHGEWLAANVPGCIVKVNDAAGHLGAGARDRRERPLGERRDRTRRKPHPRSRCRLRPLQPLHTGAAPDLLRRPLPLSYTATDELRL